MNSENKKKPVNQFLPPAFLDRLTITDEGSVLDPLIIQKRVHILFTADKKIGFVEPKHPHPQYYPGPVTGQWERWERERRTVLSRRLLPLQNQLAVAEQGTDGGARQATTESL